MNKSIEIYLPYFWLIITLSFVFTHLTNDFYVFWAYGRQVAISEETGIESLLATWDIKGLLYRAYVYHLYAVTTFFLDDFSILCQAIYKGIAIFELNLILLLAVLVLPKPLHNGAKKSTLFFISSISFIAVHFSCHLQPEMIVVPLFILTTSFYLKKNVVSIIISSIILCITFFIKSPMPIMGGTLVVIAFLLDHAEIKVKIKKLSLFSISSSLILGISLFVINLYYPQEIVDILDASHYQRTLLTGGGEQTLVMSLAHFVYHFLYGMLEYPLLLLVLPLSGILILNWYKENQYLKIFLFVISWLFPSAYIFISNCFFDYHYELYIIPAILTMLLIYQEGILAKVPKVSYKLVMVASFVYFFFLSSFSYNVVIANIKYEEVRKQNIQNNSKYGRLLCQEEILYLDTGTGAFQLGNRSYLRYFYPLPIERIEEGTPFTKTTTFIETKNKILGYQGDYLTLNRNWFFAYPHPEIEHFISDNYEKCSLESSSLCTYSWNIFSLTPYSVGNLVVYKRKEI